MNLERKSPSEPRLTPSGRSFIRYCPLNEEHHLQALQPLRDANLIPNIKRMRKSVKDPNFLLVEYEPVQGFDLYHIPEDQQIKLRSNRFAKQFANMFIALRANGFVQDDANAGNYIYDPSTNNLVAVDDEHINSTNISPNSLEDDVQWYTFIMEQVLFGMPAYSLIQLAHPQDPLPIPTPEIIETTKKYIADNHLAEGASRELIDFVFDWKLWDSRPKDFERVLALGDN